VFNAGEGGEGGKKEEEKKPSLPEEGCSTERERIEGCIRPHCIREKETDQEVAPNSAVVPEKEAHV